MGGHVVVVHLVAVSREPVSDGGPLASSKGSPARWRTFMFVTLSCHLIFMNDHRCLIKKACSFFTRLLYTVHVSAPYSKVDSMIARWIYPFTLIDTLWLFQSLSRKRPNDILAFDILFCSSASMLPSLAIILKALACTSWGQQKETLLMTYKAVVRSIINYVAPV